MTQRAKVLLACLGVTLLVVLWKNFGPSPEPAAAGVAGAPAEVGAKAAAPRGRTRAQRTGETEVKDVAALAELRLADLDASPPSFTVGRNPFAFVAPPPPPPPPPPKGPTPEQLAAKAAAIAAQQALAEQRALEDAIPKPPAITFAYVGSFGPANRRIAVLSDGTNTYNAMVGDVIEGKFRLEAIGFESIDIGFVDFPNLPAAQLPVGEEGGS